ncbi:hypothetical protein [Geomonas subterranea]|uniref:Uncharacterized protein n=1 Tax=Geomonas subterranea TaxID=2847989 RepID=A0ABX8LMQ3_9BACT|nr:MULTISPECIES: hypothetical protein [Geomonas]QXE91599.1 hypothetical protein KP001_03380 [Geomonas subterranea]QXM10310.1 hypothetical protein KP002_04115 [Geomonas subterranea]
MRVFQITALLTTITAPLAVATFFLAPGPLRGRPRDSVKKLLAAPVALLRRIHSGYVGHYITWFMCGTSLLMFLALVSF